MCRRRDFLPVFLNTKECVKSVGGVRFRFWFGFSDLFFKQSSRVSCMN